MTTFYVEGPDWAVEVDVDTDIHDTERSQLIEAGTLAIEKQVKEDCALKIGAAVIVKKSKNAKKGAFVNAYLCLNNASMFKVAENLRETFKKESKGNDLAVDTEGFSY